MADLKQGTVTVSIPDHITISDRAGNLTVLEAQRMARARRGLGLATEKTSEAMKKNPDRLAVPNLDPDHLAAQGKVAEDIDVVINDLETLLSVLKQANLLLDHEAHQSMRRALAFVRAQEKFDPRLADLVPHLIAYFSTTRGNEPTPETP